MEWCSGRRTVPGEHWSAFAGAAGAGATCGGVGDVGAGPVERRRDD